MRASHPAVLQEEAVEIFLLLGIRFVWHLGNGRTGRNAVLGGIAHGLLHLHCGVVFCLHLYCVIILFVENLFIFTWAASQ